MQDEARDAVIALIKAASDAATNGNADQAMKYAQAALNAANALLTLRSFDATFG